jgi:hypothetical protein
MDTLYLHHQGVRDNHTPVVDLKKIILIKLRQGLIKFFRNSEGKPIGVIVYRPLKHEREDNPEEVGWMTVDRDGDVIFIDFLWAPRLLPYVLKWLRWTGYQEAAWQHRETFHIHRARIEDLDVRSMARMML